MRDASLLSINAGCCRLLTDDDSERYLYFINGDIELV